MIEKLESVLTLVFENLGYPKESAKISVSSRPELCDYQINSVFKLAKENKKNPIEIGEEIVCKINELDNFDKYFKKVEFIKPGFINIIISDEIINEELNVIKNNNEFNIEKTGLGKTCVIDYGGPNIAKPLHVGHLRSAVIGESIKRILKAKGYNVISDVHLGDYGLQIGQVIYGLKEAGISSNDITLDILEELYPKVSKLCKENDEIKTICQGITKELQDGNTEYQEYWKVICDLSSKDIQSIYKFLDVSFDLWYGESDSYKYMDSLIDFLVESGVVKLDDGAKIVEVKEETDTKVIPPLILQKSDGAYLYATTDLATIYQRIKDYNPDEIVYLTDDRQRLHFEQVFRTCYKSNLVKDIYLEHNYFGTVNGPDGKPLKTRAGGTFKLKDLINEIRVNFLSKKEDNKNMSEEDLNIIVSAILKFADLQNNREKNYIFDLNKFSDVNGKTGPYILYTALRIKKLFSSTKRLDNNISTNKIYNETDKNLRMKLIELDNVLTKALTTRMPHYIAEYIYDLSVITNSFYQNNNFSKVEDERNLTDWANLLELTYNVLEYLLDLLGIKIPSEM